MQLQLALSALIEVEKKMATFYTWLAECFAADRDAMKTFRTMAEQEEGHAQQLGLQQRMVRSGKILSEVELERSTIDEVLSKIDQFRRQNPKPPLPHAVLFALRLESSDIERAYEGLLEHASPELAGLARALMKADEKHAIMLRQLMERKGAAPKDA